MQRRSRCLNSHLKVCSWPGPALLKNLLIALQTFPLRWNVFWTLSQTCHPQFVCWTIQMIFQYPLKLRLTVCRPKLLFAMCLRALDLRPRMKTIVGAIQSPLPGSHHFTKTEGHFSWEGAADMHTPETVTQLQSFWGWWTTAVHGYLTVRTMTKIYDVSFNMEWVRDTLDFWNERTFWCIEDCYHMHSCLGATRLFQAVSLTCGGGCGCCNGWLKSMVTNRWSMVWLNTFVLWRQRRRWLKWLRKLFYHILWFCTPLIRLVLCCTIWRAHDGPEKFWLRSKSLIAVWLIHIDNWNYTSWLHEYYWNLHFSQGWSERYAPGWGRTHI